jgi:DNA-binding transcriptional LysR family regulator
MFSSDDLIFLRQLARGPTLTATARMLDVSPSAVSQRLRQLEQSGKVRLVRRSGRTVVLTADGEWLARQGGIVLAELDALHDQLAQRQGGVAGELQVASSLGFGRAHVAPLLAKFSVAHPAVRAELTLTDRADQLAREHWDVIVHVGDVPDASVIAHPVAANNRVLCASPAWIARYGEPQTPDALGALPCIALRENAQDVTLWRFSPVVKSSGATSAVRQHTVAVRIKPVMASNDGEVVKTWGLQGLGAIVRSEWDIAGDLREGRLVQLLTSYQLPSAPVQALTHGRREAGTRVSTFIDALKASLSPEPWR